MVLSRRLADDEKTDSKPKVSLAKPPAGGVILPEILEVLRQEGASQIDINVLLVNIVQKVANPEEIIARSREMLAVAEVYEASRLRAFQARAEAVIDVKNRDPDEIEKRRNNRVRRVLKGVVAGCALGGIGGVIASIYFGGSIVITSLLASVTAISIAMLGPLASGESVSPSDVVRMVSALKGLVGTPSKSEGQNSHRKKGK